MTHSKSYFDNVATSWDDMRTSFFPDSIVTSVKKVMDIKPGQHIIDLGAGSGFLTLAFVNEDVLVTAIDQSQKMLDVIASKLDDPSKVILIQGDVENTNLPRASFDYIVANMLLHHVENPKGLIASVKPLLKKGGKLIITDLDKHNHEFLLTEQNDRWMGFEREDIALWYQAAGFQDFQVDCTEANCCAKSTCEVSDEADISVFIAIGTA